MKDFGLFGALTAAMFIAAAAGFGLAKLDSNAQPRPDFGWTTYEGGYIFADEDEANAEATAWTNSGGGIAYMTHLPDGVCVQTSLQWKVRPWCGVEEDEPMPKEHRRIS